MNVRLRAGHVRHCTGKGNKNYMATAGTKMVRIPQQSQTLEDVERDIRLQNIGYFVQYCMRLDPPAKKK
jgi:hypothetical protein